MKCYIDIETIPDQSKNALQDIIDTIEVKAPALTKPKLIDALGLDQKADKFKTVDELKELWIEKFGEKEKLVQAEQQLRKTSFDGAKGQICCICIAFDDEPVIKITGDETYILSSLSVYLFGEREFNATLPEPYFIGHYISGFDLPFLMKRFVINNIKPKFKFKAFGRHDSDFYDTMIAWCGYKDKISMDNLAKALGVKGKTEGMDGSKVYDEYLAGNINKIADYCADDVECVRDIYNKLNFISE